MDTERIKQVLEKYFPNSVSSIKLDTDLYTVVSKVVKKMEVETLSCARLNQVLHLASEAGMEMGFFSYYFLKIPENHPYSVKNVFANKTYTPSPEAKEIESIEQLEWGLQRFFYDAMLFWGNFRQAYRDLRSLGEQEIIKLFVSKRYPGERMISRGEIDSATNIAKDDRYLISETACKTYETDEDFTKSPHVSFALKAFRVLQESNEKVTPSRLRKVAADFAKGSNQTDLFELMYEDITDEITSEEEVIAMYRGQWESFRIARGKAIENTKKYLSICNDLDVYVATSMRKRQDFRQMADDCDKIFKSPDLAKYNLRYFDPTLSAADFHEDKGIIECLMVKSAKVVLYFAQEKESLGKVSESAMALSLGKPVIMICPDNPQGKEKYEFYKERHPLTKLIEFETGTVNGAIITYQIAEVITILDRIFSNQMEYNLCSKDGHPAFFLLKERLTDSSIRVITDNKLISQTFWNNWHGIA